MLLVLQQCSRQPFHTNRAEQRLVRPRLGFDVQGGAQALVGPVPPLDIRQSSTGNGRQTAAVVAGTVVAGGVVARAVVAAAVVAGAVVAAAVVLVWSVIVATGVVPLPTIAGGNWNPQQLLGAVPLVETRRDAVPPARGAADFERRWTSSLCGSRGVGVARRALRGVGVAGREGGLLGKDEESIVKIFF